MKIQAILNRVFVKPVEIEKTLAFYQNLLGAEAGMRFKYEEKQLELARVGDFLIVAGTDEALKPFIDTKLTIRVDSIEECKDILLATGGEILEEPKAVPSGMNMRAKHPDGIIVEYVEHRN